ncbi:hypothetical protein [Sporosarcina sp. HYO08]|uniref:hypothetical protein n=1 Tax=Sporosarcina sp. HYO08 TaxID=1759557 RepID=UPI0007949977|nr:hypothetical protein [Sporosarcina sp. HYO08]KXH83808.1 hypothetical protein AU377_03330 [Sporosarcina sp. HYO08]
MVTKSRNDWTTVWSIVAIVIALISLAYGLPSIIEMIGNGMERSSQTIAYVARLMKGSLSI